MRRRLVIAALCAAGVAVFAGLLLSAWPPSEYEDSSWDICVNCGIRRHVRVLGLINSDQIPSSTLESFHETPISRWYRVHFGSCRAHQWRYNHGSRCRYASICGIRWEAGAQERGSSPTPSLISLPAEDARALDTLFHLDPQRARAYIREQLKEARQEVACCFTARVKWIEMVGKRECEAIPLGMQFDLNWLVGIEILSIERSAKPFDKKGDVILAIHSPALFFAPQTAKNAVGKQYSFQVFGELKDGAPRYHYAELKEKENGKNRECRPDEKRPEI